ncbi:MAG: hypothetical protein AAFR98_07895 [Pseudomonadota bacterium]
MRKFFWILSGLIFALLIALTAPSVWAFFNWRQFPISSFDRLVWFMKERGVGNDCPRLGLSDQELNACFSKPHLTHIQTTGLGHGLPNYSMHIGVGCEGEGYAFQTDYIFYSFHDGYACRSQKVSRREDLELYAIGDMAGWTIGPTQLTTYLVYWFGDPDANSEALLSRLSDDGIFH